MFRFFAEQQPVFCFIHFLSGDFQFMNKIGAAFGILRFVNIGSYARSAF